MTLPERLRRTLSERAGDPARQRVLLALLLRRPLAFEGFHHHRWRRPPVAYGPNPGRCPAILSKRGSKA